MTSNLTKKAICGQALEQLMMFIGLLVSASSASAALIPTLSRSLPVAFKRKMNQGNVDHSELQMSMTLPQMPDIPNPSLFAYCEGLPENPGVNSLYTLVVHQIWKDLFPGNNLLGWKEYEKMLVTKDCARISEAFKSGSIDFDYVPRARDFYRVFLENECAEGNEIIKRYFDSGVIEEMVEIGLMSYQNIVDAALKKKNYYVANMALDALIAKHRPEINSPNFKTKTKDFKSITIIDPTVSELTVHRFAPFQRISLYCDNAYRYDKEMLRFFLRLYIVFDNFPLEPWVADLKTGQYMSISLRNCDI